MIDEREPAKVVTELGNGPLEPKVGRWRILPAVQARAFTAHSMRVQSGRRTFRYYPWKDEPGSPRQDAYFDNVHAVIQLHEKATSTGTVSAGDLVFLDGDAMPESDFMLSNRVVVLFYPSSAFAAVLELLERHKSGWVEVFQAAEDALDSRRQFTVGQLRFDAVQMG
jgi:hypothetical protein